jgi:hypothetical protein
LHPVERLARLGKTLHVHHHRARHRRY